MHAYNEKKIPFEAILIALDEHIEEEVLLEVNGIRLACFIDSYPEEFVVGKKYEVNITFEFLDEFLFNVLSSEQYLVEKIGYGFAYRLCGRIEKGVMNIGNELRIPDELFDVYVNLDGKFIELFVDRICVDFDLDD